MRLNSNPLKEVRFWYSESALHENRLGPQWATTNSQQDAEEGELDESD
ncbi:MAG: hypothetical protein R3B96_15710 [Pirellulaceae bacterium]